ncbi:MAG: hypothetical protein ACREBU_08375, partial [Nitrososphaera sp.]
MLRGVPQTLLRHYLLVDPCLQQGKIIIVDSKPALSDIGEPRFTWWKLITTIIGSGSLVFFLTVVYNDFYNQPAIVVEAPRVEAVKDGVSTTFTVRNEGRAPANNLRLTISTTDKIVDHRVVSNDEEISLTQTSFTSIVGQIPRLTENAEVAVFAAVNATEKDSLFKITLTFDEGSTKYIYSISDPVLEAERALSLS